MRPVLVGVVLAVSGCTSDPCVEGGRGRLGVKLVGLSGPVQVRLKGPASYTLTVERAPGSSEAVAYQDNVPTGRYRVDVDAYTKPLPFPRVREAYGATHAETVCPGSISDITFSPLPNSGMLWMLNGSGGNGSPLGFADGEIAWTVPAAARAKGNTGAGRALAFDRKGNAWAFAATTVDADLQRYSPAGIVASGSREPDLSFSIAPARDCGPFAASLAFDLAGNAWVGSLCKRQVFKLDAPGLAADKATLTPSVVLGGLMSVQGIAFDAAGNLWVADPAAGAVRRFDATSLTASTETPAATIKVRASNEPTNLGLLAPNKLAFDREGALWGTDFGANVLFKLAPGDLSAAGERMQDPQVRISISVGALLEGLAFDDEGSAWFPLSVGKFARIKASQLTVSTTPGAPTPLDMTDITSSPDLAYASSIEWFPASRYSPLAANLPISN